MKNAEKRYFQGEIFENIEPGALQNAEFSDCTFKNCRWTNAKIENATFISCTFERCNWNGVMFSFCRMNDAWLIGCAFRSVSWGSLQGRSTLSQTFGKLQNCEFRYNEFRGMPLQEFDFSSCVFGDCTFDDCKLVGANFHGAPLARSHFTRCDLQKADFRASDGYLIDLNSNPLKGARFSFPEVSSLLNGLGLIIE